MPCNQKNVSVRLYPEEIRALEVISRLAGWDGKSTALREFMKIWVECAVIAIEQKSLTKSSYQMFKSMIAINKKMEQIQKNAELSKKENMLFEQDLEALKDALKERKLVRVLVG